ncbi:unnamed protein product [Camellia sinensis]
MENKPTMQQLAKNDRRMSLSDDSAMMKQIQGTHSPDGRDVYAKPILQVIEDILNHVTPDVAGGMHGHTDALEERTTVDGLDAILDELAYIMHKVSCELSCKCSIGADAHATTMAILNMLSIYSWDAKVVISLAAFAVNYGEFWLVTQLVTSNQLAKSVALLKQLPDIIEHSSTLKSRFDAIKNLFKALLDVTKCIVEFKELPLQYVSPDATPMSTALTHIPTATYWTIRSMVACASQITSLLGMSYEHIASATEAWELSSLAHKISNIDVHLKNQLGICHHHIDEKRHAETFQMLIRLFEMSHVDNVRILKALIYSKDDQLPLVEGTTKKKANIEVLKRKTVLLLISDLDIAHDEIMYLSLLHQDTRTRTDLHYEIVWLPIMDRSTKPLNDANQQKFEQLQSMMPWYTLHPLLLEPAVIKYIKEFWHFDKKLILVVLDQQGRVACPNAHHMVWIWGNLAYPFTIMREELLWKEETWRLELLVDAIDESIMNWIAQEKYICLYGGEDIEWIRKFSAIAKAVAGAAGIVLEMVYVGKSSPKERVRKLNAIINAEKLSHYWPDHMSIWFFWARLESMLYSKMQHGKTIEDDLIMQGVLSVLSFNGSDQGWAIMSKGSGEMARAMGDLFLTCLATFDTWKDSAKGIGFMAALNQKLKELHTPQHCNRLILPGINGGIPEKVICAECGRPMEKYYMYRCCTD